jgi:hypothetical protein
VAHNVAAGVVPNSPANSTGAGVQAPVSRAETAEPGIATEAAAAPAAVEAQVASKSREGSQAAEALAAKDGQLAEKAAAKAARRAQRKADKKVIPCLYIVHMVEAELASSVMAVC